jgi:hypothetical protein
MANETEKEAPHYPIVWNYLCLYRPSHVYREPINPNIFRLYTPVMRNITRQGVSKRQASTDKKARTSTPVIKLRFFYPFLPIGKSIPYDQLLRIAAVRLPRISLILCSWVTLAIFQEQKYEALAHSEESGASKGPTLLLQRLVPLVFLLTS